MRTTADVTMVPPKPTTQSSDTGVPAPATEASFKKSLEGARSKQKTQSTNPAAPEAATDGKEKADTEETEATATETAVEDATVAQTPVAAKNQPGKQKAVAGKSAAIPKQSKVAPLDPENPTATKKKTARPADDKQQTDNDDTTDTSQNPAVQTVPTAQIQDPTEPIGHDGQMQAKADDQVAKVVVPTKSDSADAATTAPAQANSGEPPATDFDDAVEAAEEILGPTDDVPTAHAAIPEATPTATIAAQQPGAVATTKTPAPAPAAPLAQDAQFIDSNHPKIVTGIHGQLLPNGGSMTIRLDPPELGALQITVHLRDGVMTAAFETSSDQATRLLSHSLSQLKSSLESAGVSVEKLHVQQSPKQEFSDSSDQQSGRNQDQKDQQQEAHQEQQRRQMLNRMWRKLAGGGDPLDLVA